MSITLAGQQSLPPFNTYSIPVEKDTSLPHFDNCASSAFPGQVILDTRIIANQIAIDLNAASPPNTLAIWTDGSSQLTKHGRTASSIVYRDPRNPNFWAVHSRVLGEFPRYAAFDGEVMALAIALLVSKELLIQNHVLAASNIPSVSSNTERPILHTIIVLTDCVAVLQLAKNPKGMNSSSFTKAAMEVIAEQAQDLINHGLGVQLRLAPGHSGIEGNQRAHSVAKRVAKEATEKARKAAGYTMTQQEEQWQRTAIKQKRSKAFRKKVAAQKRMARGR